MAEWSKLTWSSSASRNAALGATIALALLMCLLAVTASAAPPAKAPAKASAAATPHPAPASPPPAVTPEPSGTVTELDTQPEAESENAASDQQDEEDEGDSPWHDGVHYLGLAAATLALFAFAGGAYIFLSARRGKLQMGARMKWRLAHMTVGGLAVTLALAHVVGRFGQGAELSDLQFHDMAMLTFPLILITGLLRHRIGGRYPFLAWAHRAAVALTIIILAMHVQHQFDAFAEGEPVDGQG